MALHLFMSHGPTQFHTTLTPPSHHPHTNFCTSPCPSQERLKDTQAQLEELTSQVARLMQQKSKLQAANRLLRQVGGRAYMHAHGGSWPGTGSG